jgi:hypothetical protein
MSKQLAKPNSKSSLKAKPSKPTELSTEQLDQATGGVGASDISVTKQVDKSSPHL